MRPALHAQAVHRTFGASAAVAGIDLCVEPGQVHALVGLNGAGKTTLMRLLVGLLRPDSGRAEIMGVDSWKAPAAIRAQLGFVGAGSCYGELTVRENLVVSAELRGLPRSAARERSEALLTHLALLPWADRPTRVLSQGNRQRVALATALVHAPPVLVLDEPTNALDPAGVLELRRTILERAAAGTAVLVSSHHLDEMARVADRITVVHAGRVVGTLAPGGPDLERQFFAMTLDAENARAGQEER